MQGLPFLLLFPLLKCNAVLCPSKQSGDIESKGRHGLLLEKVEDHCRSQIYELFFGGKKYKGPLRADHSLANPVMMLMVLLHSRLFPV